ncbi:Serine protease inhibitor- potato inhibitor I-type family protein [Striga hermonthica]|uniref:Serine protease inhibitor- potato inhibitor I-type family protein n=1 Tax=Striga hermonthica TaxID=68872 RepID=A0A9N7RP72_STRHE|nr:Serine protease inhibitor- potato inhibitor I-type family protein [Striga hermonthica]
MYRPKWTPFPPCQTYPCKDVMCCSDHHKYRVTWPELMGAEPETAKAIIERDNPYVKAVILHREEVTRDDFCCNRVYVKLDANKRVYLVPQVG